MRKIPQPDEGAFSDSHLDRTNAFAWITPALKSTDNVENLNISTLPFKSKIPQVELAFFLFSVKSNLTDK